MRDELVRDSAGTGVARAKNREGAEAVKEEDSTQLLGQREAWHQWEQKVGGLQPQRAHEQSKNQWEWEGN